MSIPPVYHGAINKGTWTWQAVRGQSPGRGTG